MNAGSGLRQQMSYAQFDPDTCSWRTSAHLFEIETASGTSSVIFTASGSMQSGRLYERPTLGRPQTVNGSTCWPTPRASMGDHMIAWSRAESGDHRSQLEDYVAFRWLREGRPRVRGLNVNPEWTDWLMGFPINHTASKLAETQSSQPSPSTSVT